MLRKLLVLILPLLAFAAGSIGGEMLRGDTAEPAPEAVPDPASAPREDVAWMRFGNQFFVPVIRNGDLRSLMILTLSIETNRPSLANLQMQEHKLRDALLRRLLIQANTGRFDGNFTTETYLTELRADLLAAARGASDEVIHEVLIEDITRQ